MIMTPSQVELVMEELQQAYDDKDWDAVIRVLEMIQQFEEDDGNSYWINEDGHPEIDQIWGCLVSTGIV